MKLNPTALYIGDNGRCFCGNHAGATARLSGHDLSGQKVHRVSDAEAKYYANAYGNALECESCRSIKENK